MFPAATMMGGDCLATPDTCLTPAPPSAPIPTPYPNTATLTQAIPPTCSKKVLTLNQPMILLGSQVSMSSGDEAGVNGGVMSGMIKGPVTFKKGSAKLIVEGQPAVLQLGVTGHNGMSANAPAGSILSPSQTKVLVNG